MQINDKDRKVLMDILSDAMEQYAKAQRDIGNLALPIGIYSDIRTALDAKRRAADALYGRLAREGSE